MTATGSDTHANPGLFRTVPKLEAFLSRLPRIWHLLNARANHKTRRLAEQKLVRARFLKDKNLLRSVGASAVIFEEQEVARAIADTVMEDLRLCNEYACPVYFADRGDVSSIGDKNKSCYYK